MNNLLNKRIEVLDQGWIELQDLMGDDRAIINAARVSFLGESKGDEADKRLLFYLMKHNHSSPFEMAEFKFRIRAPLITWWQFVRHRTWSFNAQSGRYTPFQESDFYIPEPDKWRLQSKNNKQGSDGFLHIENQINDDFSDILLGGNCFTEALINYCEKGFYLYQKALSAGVAKEQARLFLPGFGVYYTWVCKVDAHNLMHFLKLRMSPDAQYEIRVYADAIYEHFFKPALPWTSEAFEKFGLGGNDNVR
jgi:thymidylate synthase (FAD)